MVIRVIPLVGMVDEEVEGEGMEGDGEMRRRILLLMMMGISLMMMMMMLLMMMMMMTLLLVMRMIRIVDEDQL
jgi:hypothetical protein